MSSCPDIYSLQAYRDGQLCVAAREAVADHLVGCLPCRRLVGGLQRVTAPLGKVPTEAAPASLLNDLLAAVRDIQPLPALTCEQASVMMNAAADGRLDLLDVQLLQAHLLACPACYRQSRMTEILVTGLRAVPTEPVPEGLLDQLLAAVETAVPVRQPVRWWRRVSYAAAGLAAAAGLLLALVTTSPRPMEAPVVAVAPPAVERVAPPPEKVLPAALVPSLSPSPPLAVAPQPGPRPAVRTVSAPSSARPKPVAKIPTPAPVSPAPSRAVNLATLAPPAAPTDLTGLPVVEAAPVDVSAHGPMSPALPRRSNNGPRVDGAASGPSRVESTMPGTVAVTMLPAAKTTPRPEPARGESADIPEPRRSWVSRPAVEDREVYRSDDRTTRLAMARESLDRDCRTIVTSRPREFVIH